MMFQKGVLYVRWVNDRREALVYFDKDIPEDVVSFQLQFLVCMRGNVAVPEFRNSVGWPRPSEQLPNCAVVEFRKATDGDIHWFLNLWSPFSSMTDWALNVSTQTKVLDEEKGRLDRIVLEEIEVW
ncbi:MAG: hypothetical protein ABIJ36_02330 [Patescibacteria group bacterium]